MTGFRKACLVVFGLASVILLGFQFLKGEQRVGEPAGRARVASPPGTASAVGDSTSSYTPPGVIREDMGRLEIVNRVVIPEVQLAREVMMEPPLRVKFGDAPTVKFTLGDRAVAHPSASVFHGNDPTLQVPVLDAGDGTYEVAFTPTGPGQFNVVLNDGGVPVASKKVGVVGVAGAPGDGTDADFLSVDPREPRMRTAGRASRR
jgi:hypothetical protein